MKVSLNIILDALQAYRLEIYVSDDTQISFSKCLPLPDESEELSSDCIYIGGLSKAMALRAANRDIHCICMRDRIKDSLETNESLSGLIIINENITITTLFTLIQNRFFTIMNWIQQMHETLTHDGSMQDILDLSEPIFDNHISVSDSSLMLIAYTSHIYCDDPICVALAEYGYHPEETIKKFRKYDLFKTWEMAVSAYVDETCEVAKYVTIHRVFKFGNQYFAHVVLSCNRHPLTHCMMDLFQLFTDILAVCIERAWEAKNDCNHVYDTFLTDLIENNITSRSVIEERAQYVGVPLTGQFCLFQIIANDTLNMSIGKMLIEFGELFPRLKFIRYQQRIVAVNHFYSKDIELHLNMICTTMESFLQKYDALCGVSPIFSSLEEIHFSFNQSSLALKYAKCMRGSELFKNARLSGDHDSRIHFFSQKYLFCLLGENDYNAELWYHSEYHRLLMKLYQYDQRHKSNNLQLLHVFLSCERNATVAATTLNMHRNNVTYHISRIQEMLDIDLDDPTVRYMLLTSFSLLELNGFSDS